MAEAVALCHIWKKKEISFCMHVLLIQTNSLFPGQDNCEVLCGNCAVFVRYRQRQASEARAVCVSPASSVRSSET